MEVNGTLTSTHDINLYAGADVDGSDSELNIKVLSEAHNNTLLSFYTNPELNLDLENHQQVKVGTAGSADSVRHINVTADNGSETFRKDVVKVVNLLAGKKKSSKTVTNAPGVSDIKEDNDNYVNVEGRLKAGVQNNVKIDITGALVPVVISKDGEDEKDVVHNLTPVDNLPEFKVEVTNNSGSNTETIVKKEDIRAGDMDYAAQLGSQLAEVEKLITDYTNGNHSGENTAAYLGYVQQRQRILDEMDRHHLYTDEKRPVYQKNEDGTYIFDTNGEPIPVYENGEIKYEKDANGNYIFDRVYITEGFTISYVEVPEITVSGGNIVVQSGSLYGNGVLDANGAPVIEINNLSNAYLKLKGLRVGEGGGDIRFKGQSVAGNGDITNLNEKNREASFANLHNDANSSGVSTISVLNNNENIGTEIQVKNQDGKTAEYVSVPDVAVLGNISNEYGDVRIENKQGNITIGSGSDGQGANVNGRMVQLIATQGSISQDYIDGIVNIGGRPQDVNRELAEKLIEKANISGDVLPVIQTGLTPVKTNIGTAEAGRIAGDSVYVAAADINVNGLIQSGYGKYVAVIDEDVLSDENIGKLKNNGSEVTVQGRTMYKLNDGNKAVYDKDSGAFMYVVQVYYDPQSKGLVVEDIDTRGGRVYLSGRISSTGNGRILAVDGGAEIAITNKTAANLSLGKILNNDIEGKITIADLAKDTWTEFSRSGTKTITDYTSHLKESADLDQYMTSGESIGRYDVNNPKTYTTKEDLRYNWTLGQEKSKTTYYEKVTKSLFWGAWKTGSDTDTLAENEDETTLKEFNETDGRTLGSGNFVDRISDGYTDVDGNKLVDTEFGAILESNTTSTSREVTGSWKEGGHWYKLWSDPKYHTTWTTKEASTQAYTFSMKADKPIEVGFIGQEDGSITVINSNERGGNVNLNGNMLSNTKDAALVIQSNGGSIVQKSGTSLTTGRADLQAKNSIKNIQITSLGERIATGQKDADGNVIYTADDGVLLNVASTKSGKIDVEVRGGVTGGQALPGNVVLTRLVSDGEQIIWKSGDVSLKAEGNITQTSDEVTVKGRKINLTSLNGSIGALNREDGTPNQAIVIGTTVKGGLSEAFASVNAEAGKDIYLAESNGDMRIGSIVSREGDVRLEAKEGRFIDALPQTNNGNNVASEELVRPWIDAGLIAGTEDYEGAYIQGLKKDAANYKARVEEQYAMFKRGEGPDALTKMFTYTKADGAEATYASADEYLAADARYKALTDAYDPDKVEYPWTKEQLLYAIRNAIVNKESGVNAETQGKVANVQGHNVILEAKGVGVHDNKVTEIDARDLSGGTETSIANLQQLADADANDVIMKDAAGNILLFTVENGKQTVRAYDAANPTKEVDIRDSNGNILKYSIDENGTQVIKAYDANDPSKEVETDGVIIDKFVIGNLSPLGVYATGQLDVTAGEGNVFIAGRSNDQAGFTAVNVGQIVTDGGDVRLYTQEGIYNAAATGSNNNQANILAKDLIAYGGVKDIGEQNKPLAVSLSGDLLEAYADGNVYIRNAKDEDKLRVGSVFAKNAISLESAKGIDMTVNPNYSLAYLSAGSLLELKTSATEGEIGTEENPVRILNNAEQEGNTGDSGMLINLEGKDAYVKGVNGMRGDNSVMRLGVITVSGAFEATSEGNLEAGADQPEEKDETGSVVRPAITGQVKAGGDVKLEAVNTANINGALTANTISVSGTKGVFLNDRMKAGELRLVNGEYTGGGLIELVSGEGLIQQNEKGVLEARRVTATGGRAIQLANEGNTFREFMGQGAETEEKDEQGNAVRAVNGNVNVSAHAGNALSGGIRSTTVYGDVTLTNLDAGGLTVTTDIAAKKGKNGKGGNITFRQAGNVKLEGDVTAENNVKLTSEQGNIKSEGNVTAGSGDVSAVTTSGDIRLAGDVIAGSNVKITSSTGRITAEKSVSAGRNIQFETASGDVTLAGDVNAGQNLSVESESGRIEVFGKASTVAGDVSLKTSNATYVPGTGGQKIVIGKNGRIESARNATLLSKNADLYLPGRIAAKNVFTAVTEGNGNITLDSEVTTDGSLVMKADNGNINAGNITAGNRIDAETGKGDITVGTADAVAVSLVNRDVKGKVNVNTIRVEARGNASGTAAEDVLLAGNDVAVGSLVNKSKSLSPLTISTAGASRDRAMNSISIGTRNKDGSYKGGIFSSSGAVMQQLWTDNGMLYVNGKTNLHISKLVVNDKLHAANARISVGVYGRTPSYDGEQVVYWNNSGKNNPAGMQDRWYSRSYTDPNWMYLDLFGKGSFDSGNGTLIDSPIPPETGDPRTLADILRIQMALIPPVILQHSWYIRNFKNSKWIYPVLFGSEVFDSEKGISVIPQEDLMNRPDLRGLAHVTSWHSKPDPESETESESDTPNIVYFDRNNLIKLDDCRFAEEKGSITVE
ncbi:MAG: hypothetical protein J6E49_06890 [Acidaminococcaceae bacterium]|nr:hypothetical protein [Acidaminococcaceae bacterium]